MRNFGRNTSLLSLALLFFACGKKDVEEEIAQLRAEAPTSFQLINNNGKSYDLALTFLGDFKPGLGNLTQLGCAGDVIEFKTEAGESLIQEFKTEAGESLIQECKSLTLSSLEKDDALSAAAGEGASVYIASLAEITADKQASFEVSPLNPENFDTSYQLIFDLQKLVKDEVSFADITADITAATMTVKFKTLPKIEFAAAEENTLHLLFKKHENAKAFAEKIKLLTADELLSCEPEATVQALDKEGGCLSEVKILATLDDPSEGKKLSLQESSGLYIHKLNFNHRQDSDALQFSISQDYLIEWNKSSTGLVTPPASAAEAGAATNCVGGFRAGIGITCTSFKSSCPAGQKLIGGTSISDKTCTNCVGGFRAGIGITCTSFKSLCPAGQTLIGGTSISNKTCTNCVGGFRAGIGITCTSFKSLCPAGQTLIGGTTTSDKTCTGVGAGAAGVGAGAGAAGAGAAGAGVGAAQTPATPAGTSSGQVLNFDGSHTAQSNPAILNFDGSYSD